MNNRDLNFLKTINEKVNRYNKAHKSIKLVVYDTWNPTKDHYDYRVGIKYQPDVKIPTSSKIRAEEVAQNINNYIKDYGYLD